MVSQKSTGNKGLEHCGTTEVFLSHPWNKFLTTEEWPDCPSLRASNEHVIFARSASKEGNWLLPPTLNP
jgi:hypothetical protein